MKIGSYPIGDVTFLLKPINQSVMGVADKEAHILRGGHYSEVVTAEDAPGAEYMALFGLAVARNKEKLGQHVVQMALFLEQSYPLPPGQPRVIASLARAGTPVGVLLKRTLEALGRPATHYCVSIIRDRGIDANALRYILDRHPAEALAFVDGWTGKGVIGRELAASVAQFNEAHGTAVSPNLHVVMDIARTAYWAATDEDYLMPSALLNSTVSGLVSRTVLNEQVGPTDFHACRVFEELRAADVSVTFVDTVFSAIQANLAQWRTAPVAGCVSGNGHQAAVEAYLAAHQLGEYLRVKPGIGEATRVLLRRAPKVLVLADMLHPDVAHLLFLAQAKHVPVVQDATLPCRALAVIKGTEHVEC